MLIISERIESARLNGHRIPGEYYLVGNLVNFQCCKLPFPLSANLLPKRGLLPMPGDLFRDCTQKLPTECPATDHSNAHYAGMLWISERYYSHAAMWMSEARTLPVQVRIKNWSNVEIGASWVYLAHRKAIVDYSDGASGWVDEKTGEAHTVIKYKPGIFTMFQVQAIEYVVQDRTKTDFDFLQGLKDKGITLVRVITDEFLASADLDSDKELGYE